MYFLLIEYLNLERCDIIMGKIRSILDIKFHLYYMCEELMYCIIINLICLSKQQRSEYESILINQLYPAQEMMLLFHSSHQFSVQNVETWKNV